MDWRVRCAMRMISQLIITITNIFLLLCCLSIEVDENHIIISLFYYLIFFYYWLYASVCGVGVAKSALQRNVLGWNYNIPSLEADHISRDFYLGMICLTLESNGKLLTYIVQTNTTVKKCWKVIVKSCKGYTTNYFAGLQTRMCYNQNRTLNVGYLWVSSFFQTTENQHNKTNQQNLLLRLACVRSIYNVLPLVFVTQLKNLIFHYTRFLLCVKSYASQRWTFRACFFVCKPTKQTRHNNHLWPVCFWKSASYSYKTCVGNECKL
jgi:hypothetical protein